MVKMVTFDLSRCLHKMHKEKINLIKKKIKKKMKSKKYIIIIIIIIFNHWIGGKKAF